MRKAFAIIAMGVLASVPLFAEEPPHQDPELLNAIHHMRTKQEQEENVVRVIQQPVTVNQDVCGPAELARQRIRDLGGKDGQKFGTIDVEAGHGDVSIDNNSGEINNSVNVQVVAPNDRKCF